jgi:hypothetical protein
MGSKIAAAAAATYFSGGLAAPALAKAISSNPQGASAGVNPYTGAASGAADYLNRDFYRSPTGGQQVPSMTNYNFASGW